ncbi:MAG: FecR domain-containing protein [Candidatus Pseudobacter hemicellulosilyticus]|uniref:FecR domain-containing protein n=1 Tax=Candidatus Pseudobacter hemicellulosilyticus TaxID=3121375 RepID=A0AAJ5WS13_9BACT|nr:MAG: FecR domain-containing protein [Pseudobacter sp.]
MKITEALIERFFNNDCDEAEQLAVKNYFRQHPEVLRKYMTEPSWKTFETNQSVPGPVAEKMLDMIRQQTYGGRRRMMIRNWAAAAAAILLITGSAYWLSNSVKKQPAVIAATEKPVETPAPANFHTTANTTGKLQTLILEDSTKVELAPNSTLSYPVPFQSDRRQLTLKGQAVFYVAKDPGKPFTVFAGKLATTAIGTVFRITAFAGKPTSVHLLSGKVRVEADSSIAQKTGNVLYLLPGQALQLNAERHLVLLNKKEKAFLPVLTLPQKAAAKQDEVMVFRNESLETLFTSLSEKYQVKIVFKPAQVSGMSFTGRYDRHKETLSEFIETISLLNNLVVREENGTILIEGK